MSEKVRISEYKGFELWDCPMPEGWRVHPYPVQVTCNGEHVNNFANTHDAMKTIDGMDADTVAYHKRQAPAPAVASAAADVSEQDLYEAFFQDKTYGAVKALFDKQQAELDSVKAARDGAVLWSQVTQANWNDCGKALAAILKERDVSELTVGGYYIYEAMGDTADAFPVNTQGQRIHAKQASAPPADGEGGA